MPELSTVDKKEPVLNYSGTRKQNKNEKKSLCL